MSRLPGVRRRDVPGHSLGGLARWYLRLVFPAGLLTGCATAPSPPTEESGPDPVGVYDLSMSSAIQVSDGVLEISRAPGGYRGLFTVGPLSVVISGVEVGTGVLSVRARLPEGTLILRLTGDGRRFAGNWVLGTQRGTVTAEKRPPPRGSRG